MCICYFHYKIVLNCVSDFWQIDLLMVERGALSRLHDNLVSHFLFVFDLIYFNGTLTGIL